MPIGLSKAQLIYITLFLEETLISDTTAMLKELPVSEQKFAYEFVKRLVLAWDPDYTKLTPNEELNLKEAEEEYKNGDYIEYKF